MTEPDEVAEVKLTVDGAVETFEVRAEETLLASLRERLGTSGVRYCCGIGVCGTCTVLLDGAPASSCLLLTVMTEGREIVTPRGLAEASPSELSAAQHAFVDAGAFQCSYCIPAMALTVQGVFDAEPDATADDICTELGGNLCRCGSYPQARAAVEALVAERNAPSTTQRNASRPTTERTPK